MSELVPCAVCRRHYVVDESACPFCAAPGRLVRAAAIAGALTAGGCWTSSSPTQVAHQDPPPPPPPVETAPIDAAPPADPPPPPPDAQVQAQQQQFAQPVGTASISGRVLQNGMPSRDQAVSVTGRNGISRAALSDQGGRYAFDKLPAGTYDLYVGYQSHPRRPLRPTTVTIKDGETKSLDLVYVPPPRQRDMKMPYGAPPASRRIV